MLGVIAALRRNGFLDYAAMSLAVLGISIPNFILATLLIQQFAVNLKLFPAATWTSPIHMVLPTAALAVGPMAIIARLTRSSMVEVLTQDYIRTAKAKGLSPFKIIVKHALRNALMPVITVLGTLVASILTGSFVIEKSLPMRSAADFPAGWLHCAGITVCKCKRVTNREVTVSN